MNERIRLRKQETLADDWFTLRKITFDYQRKNGTWETQSREAYDRGNGATILLHDPATDQVILTRQFRLPTFVNGNPTGMLIETCAGLLMTSTRMPPSSAKRRKKPATVSPTSKK